LPAISSNGDSEPSSTSEMRNIFSASTDCISCGAEMTTNRNSMNTGTIGTTTERMRSCFWAGATCPSAPRAHRPSESAPTWRASASATAGGTWAALSASARTRSSITRASHSRSWSSAGWSE
jgi:hypothetical protein